MRLLLTVSGRGVYLLLPAVTFHITAVYQLRPGLFRDKVLVASLGHYLVDLLVIQGFPKSRFQKIFVNKMKRWCSINTNVSAT